MTTAETVVFFDGVCGLCDRFVQFLLTRDRHGALRFAPLQGDIAQRVLAKHGLDPSNLDSVVVVRHWGLSGEVASTRSRAVLEAVEALGGAWAVASRAARLVPVPLANAVYNAIARSRYRLFGRFDACRLPPADWKERFLE